MDEFIKKRFMIAVLNILLSIMYSTKSSNKFIVDNVNELIKDINNS